MKNIDLIVQKQKITNEEFLHATNELREIIKKESAKQEPQNNINDEDIEMNDDDDGFETCSEEDISDDEKTLH